MTVATRAHSKDSKTVPANRGAVNGSHLLDAVSVACACFAEDTGALRYANPAFQRQFARLPGYATRVDFERAFQPFKPLGPGNDQESASADSPSEEAFCPSLGEWFRLDWHRVAGDNGEGLSSVTATNVSERMEHLQSHKSHAEQLLFTSRLMSVGEMAATVAHELNHPLATIVNCIAVSLRALEAGGQKERLLQALDLAKSQAEHASGVVDHVREFVKARTPKLDSYQLTALVESVLGMLQLDAQRHRVQIAVSAEEDLPDVLADRIMIEQVLLNLVKNAIDAMRNTAPDKRRVAIAVRRLLDDDIEVRVTDRGCGLATDDPNRVFAPFFTTKADGLGVGLAICRSIIEFHQGRLFAEDNPAGGSVFVFTLPSSPGGTNA